MKRLAAFAALMFISLCAAADTPAPVSDPYAMLGKVTNKKLGAIIIVSQGQFQCAAGMHRATFIDKNFAIVYGCALIDLQAGAVRYVFENGQVIEVPIDMDKAAPPPTGHTDGPAKEDEFHPGVVPKRNS